MSIEREMKKLDEEKFFTGSKDEMPPEVEDVLMLEGMENVISHDAEAPSAMREYAAEQEKMADAQFELLREFQQEEKEALASVEAPEKGADWMGRAKKGLMALTAGVMLMSAMPVFGGELQRGAEHRLTDKEKIEQQIQKLQEEKLKLYESERVEHEKERIQELQGYLDSFHVKGLTLGKSTESFRCCIEVHGIYLDGKHLGNTISEVDKLLSHDEFIGDAKKILKENGIEYGEQRERTPTLEIAVPAQEVMDTWGWSIRGGKLYWVNGTDITEYANLNNDGKTEKISVIKVGKDKFLIIATDRDGTVNKLEVNRLKFRLLK